MTVNWHGFLKLLCRCMHVGAHVERPFEPSSLPATHRQGKGLFLRLEAALVCLGDCSTQHLDNTGIAGPLAQQVKSACILSHADALPQRNCSIRPSSYKVQAIFPMA